jgi:inner membrane protein
VIAKSHAIIGVASWIVVAPFLHLPSLSSTSLALAFVGSLLPDIDHPSSWVGRRSRPISTVVSGVFGHRGITHSAVAVVALVALLTHTGYARAITSALAVGYLSHLAADMLTPRGLRLAWPLRKTWAFPVCTTGSPAEAIVVAGLCLLAGFCLLRGHPLQVHFLHFTHQRV